MRTAAFQRPMLRLALFAMLLLACLPTLGRLASSSDEESGSVLAALCTMTGLKYVEVPLGDPAPQPRKSMGEDCAYCPLLTAVAAFSLWLALAWPSLVAASHVPVKSAPHRKNPYPCGLGSRGPPLAL